jgi:hypothetical protein
MIHKDDIFPLIGMALFYLLCVALFTWLWLNF